MGARIGDYQLENELLQTVTTSVYRAVHSVLPRRVLLKLARTNDDGGAASSIAVLREACILAALPHPGIVRVYETGRLFDGRTWFACELVEGLSLDAALAPDSKIDPGVAVGMIRDVAEILAHAHQRGVIHCGITPNRLVVAGRTRGFPMCINDWSAARAHDAQPTPIADIGPYAAPECAEGHAVDDRADVFALGVIAYRALTGVMPFAQFATDASGEQLHVPTEVRCPELPRELTAVIDQMLARDRFDRPSAAEVREQLAFVATSLGVTPREVVPDVVRIRRPRWTPQIDFARRADTDADVPAESDPTDPHR